jgi:hypothetical protein
MDSIDSAKQNIRTIISGSSVPEDPIHAENTLDWLLKLDPEADQALQIAALAHDIDRAVEAQKVRRADFSDYNAFKVAHAHNGARILREILSKCGVAKSVLDEACRLVTFHEVGGDPRSDLLKDADSVSYFEVNMPLYYQREGRDETKRRCNWGYQRLSARMKEVVKTITHEDESITHLLKEVICEQNQHNYDVSG